MLSLLLLGALAAAACGGGGGSGPAAPPDGDDAVAATPDAPAPEPPADPVEPAPSVTPPIESGQVGPAEATPDALESEPLIFITPRRVKQGRAVLVAIDAPGAGFASVAYEGQVFTLLREGSRFYTLLPVAALTPPGPLPIVVAVADAEGRIVLRRETLITVIDAQWPVEVVELDRANQALLNPAVIAEDQAVRDAVQRQETPERHWSGLFAVPAAGVITSNFGLLRSYNFAAPSEYHTGLDFGAEHGALVVAPNAGVVAWVGQTRRRGNGVIVDHGGGLYTSYYHMSEVLVAPGQLLGNGDAIGRVGATGLATGPHLHWEVVVHGVPVDPVQWIQEVDFLDPTAAFDAADALQAPARSGG